MADSNELLATKLESVHKDISEVKVAVDKLSDAVAGEQDENGGAGMKTKGANMTQLQPHQQRVVDEKRELDERIEKLFKFLMAENFRTVVADSAEQGRLTRQHEVMVEYSRILGERIAAF